MEIIIARCGFRCHLCPAFVENARTREDQARGALAWSRYFAVEVLPDRMRCNGCLSDDDEGPDFPDKNCPVRPCTAQRGLENCSGCKDYICEKLEQRMRGYEEAAKRFQGKIAKEDFEKFIAPYDSRKTLNEIRATNVSER